MVSLPHLGEIHEARGDGLELGLVLPLVEAVGRGHHAAVVPLQGLVLGEGGGLSLLVVGVHDVSGHEGRGPARDGLWRGRRVRGGAD